MPENIPDRCNDGKTCNGIYIVFILVVAGFNILAILTMIVLENQRISYFKSNRATTRGIMSIFLLNGLLIGCIGACAGVAIGLSIVLELTG